MINSYDYIYTDQSRLHEFVIAFFERIQNETGVFSSDLFVDEFYNNLVFRHRTILRKAFKDIYEIVKGWEQPKRTILYEAIIQSNNINEICAGNIIPWKEEDIPEEIREITFTLFIKLYDDVLMGNFFKPIYGSRKDHFKIFKHHGRNDYEYCPACGIVPLQTFADDITDQYDHYLSKDIYPFSSINFYNLVPICRICNSIEVKGTDDILCHGGKVFFPFDENHKGININLTIAVNNNDDLSLIEWAIDYSNSDGKEDEINAWKTIYKIVTRHKSYIKGNIKRWYKNYWDDFNNKETAIEIPDENNRTNNYLRKLENRNILEYKSMNVILSSADEVREEEARYSRY